jgi:hypothetical protein
MAFDGYVRISRVGGREGDSFLSPAIQRDSIRRQAKAKGVDLGELVEEAEFAARREQVAVLREQSERRRRR